MQGNDAAVLVPQDQALRALTRSLRADRRGVVSRW